MPGSMDVRRIAPEAGAEHHSLSWRLFTPAGDVFYRSAYPFCQVMRVMHMCVHPSGTSVLKATDCQGRRGTDERDVRRPYPWQIRCNHAKSSLEQRVDVSGILSYGEEWISSRAYQ